MKVMRLDGADHHLVNEGEEIRSDVLEAIAKALAYPPRKQPVGR